MDVFGKSDQIKLVYVAITCRTVCGRWQWSCVDALRQQSQSLHTLSTVPANGWHLRTTFSPPWYENAMPAHPQWISLQSLLQPFVETWRTSTLPYFSPYSDVIFYLFITRPFSEFNAQHLRFGNTLQIFPERAELLALGTLQVSPSHSKKKKAENEGRTISRSRFLWVCHFTPQKQAPAGFLKKKKNFFNQIPQWLL